MSAGQYHSALISQCAFPFQSAYATPELIDFPLRRWDDALVLLFTERVHISQKERVLLAIDAAWAPEDPAGATETPVDSKNMFYICRFLAKLLGVMASCVRHLTKF